MGKITVDIGALIGALTKTPTAQDNPAFGAEEQQYEPSYNWQTGKTNPIPSEYFSPTTGGSIDPEVVKKYGTTNPVITPTRMQHLFHPEASQAVDSMNNQARMHSVLPGIDNDALLRVRAGNVGLMDQALRPNTTPLSAAVSGYGNPNQTPTEVNLQNESLLTAQHGLPGVKAATDINAGQYDLTASKGALDRQNMEQSVISGDLVNRWNTTYGLTPQQISLAERQVKAELGFQGSVEQIREKALQNQFEEQSHIIPAEQNLRLTQTGNSQNIASETSRLWPYTKTALDNRAIGEAAVSHYLPEMDRFANTIQPDGSIAPRSRNPLGMSPFEIQMKSLGDLQSGGGQTIKDSSGKSYMIPAAPPSNIDPLTGGPAISSTNGPTVTHDTSGSMTPSVSSKVSSTTLPQTIAPSLNVPLNTGSSYVYNTGMAEAGDQLAKQKVAAGALYPLLGKYAGNQITDAKTYFAKSPPVNYSPDPDKILDFIHTNAKSMSKGDLKQALTLLHQIQ